MNRKLVFNVWFASLLLLLLTGCPRPSPTGGPRVWIDAPREDASVPLGPVEVVSHATDDAGIARVQLYVNGRLVREDRPPDSTALLVTVRQAWVPDASGTYVLYVQAENGNGLIGRSSPVRVTVGGAASAGPPATSTPAARLRQLRPR